MTARFRAAASPFGIDIIYFLHLYPAVAAAALAFNHFAILWLFYQDALGVLNPLKAPWNMTSGRIALGALVLAVVTSEWREWLLLEYGLWRMLYIVLAMVGFEQGSNAR